MRNGDLRDLRVDGRLCFRFEVWRRVSPNVKGWRGEKLLPVQPFVRYIKAKKLKVKSWKDMILALVKI